MLVITRKRGERAAFLVNGEVVGYLVVTEAHGEKARVGVALNPAIKVLREELLNGDEQRQLQAIVDVAERAPDERDPSRMALPTDAERRADRRPPGRGARSNGKPR